MKKFLKGASEIILAPVIVGGAAALVLYLLGTVPGYLPGPQEGFKEYITIEEAEADLGFDIIVPTYFPGYLSWPPASIWGQAKPVSVAQTTFLSSEQRIEVLVVSQIVSDSDDLPISLPWIETVTEEIPVTIGNRQGLLAMGRGTDGLLLNAVYWKTDDLYFVMVTTHPVQELLLLARSMHP